jgi:type I restriction enzyme, R subunit
MSYSEAGVVEKPIIQWLQDLNWTYLTKDDLELYRPDLEEVLLIDKLKAALRKLNPFELTENDLAFVITTLRTLPPTIEGIRKFVYILKNGLVVTLEKDQKQAVVKLFDFSPSGIDNNEFIVTNQFSVHGREDNIRADVVLIVNGVPLVLIEAKNPSTQDVTWVDAYTQIKRYERTAPDLFKFVQFSMATDGARAFYFPHSFAEENKDFLSEWKDPFPYVADKIGNNLVKIAVYGMLSRPNLLDLVENFVFVRKEKDQYTKVMTRYMQYRAANRMYSRVVSSLGNKKQEKQGLVWHWQGSGKTYTMAFAANKLHLAPAAENPSIFVVVDRKDLEKQIEEDFSSLGVPVERVASISKLIDALRWGNEGKRGIFVVTIEKFQDKAFGIAAKAGKVELSRENVIAMTDESHRTQYGNLAIIMRSVLKNAFVFGFTGTPLSKPERNTFSKFSPRGELYLDRYSMTEAKEDGFTVPLTYEPRLPEYHLNQKQLDELEEFEEEVEEELSAGELKELRRKVSVVKAILKKPDRIKAVARDIAEHFQKVVEPTGLKGIIVTVDKEACVLYKEALDDHLLPPEVTVVVMSHSQTGAEVVLQYQKRLQKEFGKTDFKEIHREIIERFKTKPDPKMLIVTDMLITGFDSPNLWAMYLDKPLKEHRILQAIARTNRPFANKKYGLILDYIGVLKDLEKAFSIFEADDLKNLKLILRDQSAEKEHFVALLTHVLAIFSGKVKKEDTLESLDSALTILVNQETAKDFETTVKELMRSFEMLSGDPFLSKFLSDYKWMVKIYWAYYRKFKRADFDELKIAQLSKKTYALVQQTMDVQEVAKKYPVVTIDENYVRAIRGKAPGLSAAIDIIGDIQGEIRRRPGSPFYGSISEQVKHLYDELGRKGSQTTKILAKLTGITEQIAQRNREEKEVGTERYPIYEALKTVVTDIDKGKAVDFADYLTTGLKSQKLLFRGWQQKRDIRRKVKEEVRIQLLGRIKEARPKIDKLTDAVFNALEGMKWRN